MPIGRIDTRNRVNRAHPLNQGRIAWWSLLPAVSGGKFLYDLIGTKHGKLDSAVLVTDSTRPGGGNQLLFPASIGNNVGFGAGAGNFDRFDPFSVAVWVYVNDFASDYHVIVAKMDGNGPTFQGWDALINQTTGTLSFQLINNYPNAIDLHSSAAFPLAAWTHLLITYSGSSTAAGVSLYVNGRPFAKAAPDLDALTGSISNSVALQIGSRVNATTTQMSGAMDDISLWSRCLTPGDAAALYRESAAGNPTTLNRVGATAFPFAASTGVTISFAAAAQSAAGAFAVTNTPPAQAVTVAGSAQAATVALSVTNTPPARTVTFTATAQSASGSLTVTNVPPASLVTLAGAAQSATASLTATNTPPASLVTLAGSAQSATVALTVTNTAPAGSVTFAAAAQPATGSFTATNTPPASLVTLTGSAQAASASLTVTNTQPAGTISFAAAAQAASGSFNATNTPPASVVTFAGQGQAATAALTATNTPPPGLVTLTAAAQSASAAFAVTNTLPAGTVTFAAAAGAAASAFTVAITGVITLSFRQSLAAALLASPAVASVVGARVFPLYVPESQSLPALVYKVSTDRAEQNLAGHNGVNQADVLFIVEARKFSECETIGRAVFDLFHDLTGPVAVNGVTVVEVQSVSDTDGYDFPIDSTDRGTFTTPLQYTFRYRKAKPSRP